ncbi:MAG: anthranilate synthase component I family protein [Kofleriaceae bacterium]
MAIDVVEGIAGPIDGATRLAGLRGRVVLHSGRDDDGLARNSFVAAEPTATLIARGRSLVVLDETGRPQRRFTGDPFAAAEDFLREHGCVLGDGPETGPGEPRVIGFFSYDLARVVEKLPGGPTLGHDTPDLWLAAYGAVARFGTSDAEPPTIIGPDDAARARLRRHLEAPRPQRPAPVFGPLEPDDDDTHYIARVEKIKDYLGAGDVYQVNLARRLVARVTMPGDVLALYTALLGHAPAPYGALMEADGLTLLSSSPERFLASVGDRIETRPIKGTHTHGEALAASTKDAAEHLMIVDLERNDLGRIAQTGSVVVDDLGYIVELPSLYHKVSRISARPRAGVGFGTLLRAMFPGGSITGAPKVRAMEIIDELEPARRGPYCGAFGYFGARGAFDLAIAIRIGVLKSDELRIHVGGGIVADSDPAAELAETELKATGWRRALEAVARSHDPARR